MAEVFNKAAFQKRCVYDSELELTILEGSLGTLREQLHKIGAYFEAADYYQVERNAHSLKGTSGTLSAERLSAAAMDLELRSREIHRELEASGPPVDAAELIQLDESIQKAFQEYSRFAKRIRNEYLIHIEE